MGSFLRCAVVAMPLIASMWMISAPVVASGDDYPTYPSTKASHAYSSEQIKHGEYLAKMGDCIACHTNTSPGSPPYAGGLPIATPFGTFYSPNITPDKETGIGAWTESDFIRALKQGKDPKGRNYFPVFPYLYFANATDADLRAMYAYFMSIPAVKQPNRPLPFPFGVPGARTTLLGWNLLFFYPNTWFENNPNQSAAWNRGKYIVDGLGHCSMCHTPLNPLGAPKNRFYLTGTFIDGYWAPNITKQGLESATPHQISDVFVHHQLLNQAGPVAGPMAEVNHNSLQYLNESDRLAIGEYLKTVVSEDPIGLTASDQAPTLSRGRKVYLRACSLCHQDGQMAAPRIGDGPNWMKRLQSSGLKTLQQRAINGYNSMPIKGACVACSDNDIIAAVDYILEHSLTRSQRIGASAVVKTDATVHPVAGEVIYNEHCSGCHADGVSGAPKIGDKAAWKPLLAKNMDGLVEVAIKGKHHPANGGCKACTTGDIMAAIQYIVRQSTTQGNYSLW